MSEKRNFNINEENDLKKIKELVTRNYRLFLVWIVIALALAYAANRLIVPVYRISSSVLIREEGNRQQGRESNEYLNSSLIATSQNFQNELWVLKSSPVLDRTVRNLDLSVTYYRKKGFRYFEVYKESPVVVKFQKSHVQPVNVRFFVNFIQGENFEIKAEAAEAAFYNFGSDEIEYRKTGWSFSKNAVIGELIETPDLSFVIEYSTDRVSDKAVAKYAFEFTDVNTVVTKLKKDLEVLSIGRQATVAEIGMKSTSVRKGTDVVDEIMAVYSRQNLDRKNHMASMTINYIENQLSQISDSLSQTEDQLQRFRSVNQVLNVPQQSSSISAQYVTLQNQLAELTSRKNYYDYVSDYLAKNSSYSDLVVPSSLGIQDQLLNSLVSELISLQSQQNSLIRNNQEMNPQVQRLKIQIENLKKTISGNISASSKTTGIAIEDMTKRVRKIESDISKLPATERQLGNIERKYKLNDAIYNYLLEKHAEAKITKASNLPDDIVIEPARMDGFGPVFPRKNINYAAALLLGLIIPFGYLLVRNEINNKVDTQDDVEKLSGIPILGKIPHSKYKTNNVVYEYPKTSIAEAFRALRTNLDFYVRGGQKKVVMVTSSISGEGKSFVALNIAMSYAQLGRRTILLDFDLRKPEYYFEDQPEKPEGLTSYLIGDSQLEQVIHRSPHDRLDYILAGVLPPNPTELMALDKTRMLLDKLRAIYDCIIIDTTPLAQVSDAYLLIEHAEVKVTVVRYNFSVKKILALVLKDLQQKNIEHVCIVMNDNRYSRDQYGYGYGYQKTDYRKGRK